MRNNYISIFDVIGPTMVGPSSSHTSGAATIAWMARQILSGTPVKAEFTLYGSFADTYKGHGTNRALIGGVLGYSSSDLRIRDSYEYAKEAGLKVAFREDHKTETAHPNTVDVRLTADDGHVLEIRGESIGGGRVRLVRINDIDVDITGEYCSMIIGHRDESGTIAYVTGRLANYQVNIAFMKLFRESSGGRAFTVIKSDNYFPDAVVKEIMEYPTIESVDLIEF